MLAVSSASAAPEILTARDAHLAQKSGTVVLIDVRTPNEWQRTGLPQGALGATLQDNDFIDQVFTHLNGDKSKPVALICRTGRRSQTAAERLEQAGFTAIFNVREGFAGRSGAGPGWKAQKLPIDPVSPSGH